MKNISTNFFFSTNFVMAIAMGEFLEVLGGAVHPQNFGLIKKFFKLDIFSLIIGTITILFRFSVVQLNLF